MVGAWRTLIKPIGTAFIKKVTSLNRLLSQVFYIPS